jgi:nitroreductase
MDCYLGTPWFELKTTRNPMAILSDNDFEQILTAAISAPSGGNMQPWLIKRDGDAIILSINHARSHNLLDVHGAAAIFSLGMLAENILIKSSSLGYRQTLNFTIENKHSKGNLVVVISYEDKGEPVNIHPDLSHAISQRCTNRCLHIGEPIPDQIIQSLSTHFANSGCQVAFLSNVESKRALLKVLATNDALRLRHHASLAQLLREIRWNEKETKSTRDGIDIKTLELPKGAEQFLRLLRSIPQLVDFLPVVLLKQFTRPPVLHSSHFGLVAIKDAYSDRSMFQAGRHTQHLWLKSTDEKIGFQPYTVLTFNLLRVLLASGEGFSNSEQATIHDGAREMCRIFGMPDSSVPVFIFRLARAPEPKARSLRLPKQTFLH